MTPFRRRIHSCVSAGSIIYACLDQTFLSKSTLHVCSSISCHVFTQACLFLQVIEQLGQFEQASHRQQFTHVQAIQVIDVPYPVIVWWSPLTGELGRLGECGRNRCFFTVNKSYHSHPQTKAFLFYGECNCGINVYFIHSF